jgi:hypothetical protein
MCAAAVLVALLIAYGRGVSARNDEAVAMARAFLGGSAQAVAAVERNRADAARSAFAARVRLLPWIWQQETEDELGALGDFLAALGVDAVPALEDAFRSRDSACERAALDMLAYAELAAACEKSPRRDELIAALEPLAAPKKDAYADIARRMVERLRDAPRPR